MSDNSVTLTEEEAHKFKLLIDEIVTLMTSKAQTDQEIKEKFTAIKDDYNIKPKVARAIAKAAFKCDFNEVREEYTEILDLYETVMTN